MKLPATLLALLLLLLLAACEQDSGMFNKYDNLLDKSKPLAFGKDSEVALFIGVPSLEESAAVLDSSITRKVTAVVEEQYFDLVRKDADKIDEYARNRNLVFCGTLTSPDPISAYMRGSLSESILAKVKASGAELVILTNANSRDQITLYLLATDNTRLAKLISERADQVFTTLLERYKLRLAYQVYRTKVMEPSVFQDLPFSLQLPITYQIFKEDKPNRFLSYIFQPRIPDRKVADKYVSVYHEAMPQNIIDATWIYNKRQDLGKTYFDGDTVDAANFRSEPVTIAGYQGWRIYGAWTNKDLNAGVGGAFQTFAFWHAASKTAYLLDNLVFFPDGEKLRILLELGMVTETFVVK